MDPKIPPTREEALALNKDALMADIDRKRNNVEMLKGEIERTEAEMAWMLQAVAIIDANKRV